MSQLKTNPFQLSLIAVAIISLSACSTAPKIAGVDLAKVGSKTAEISSNAWEGTKNILNIGPTESEILDEVDLALMEDNSQINGVVVASTDIEQLLPQGDTHAALTDSNTNQTLQQENNAQLAFGEVPQAPSTTAEIVVLADSNQQLATGEVLVLASANGESVPLIDLTHEVAESETLWDIAKATTGDANNWHVLADINNLAPNASVFVGQKLTIPADMVKPYYAGTEQPIVIEVAQADLAQPAVAISVEAPATVALKIPEPQSAVVVATAEQIKPAAPADAANIMTDATALKVGQGETLWDFAKRTTGDATNWKTIADKNLLTEQQLATIRPGQKIYVPSELVRARDENGALIAKGAEGMVPTATVGGVTPANKQAIDASTAVLAGTNTPAEGDIKIVEAAYQDNNGIAPVSAEALAAEASTAVASSDAKMGKVMVRGTYYPKAVYNTADFSSSLLMRVSPGTELIVSKAVGPWLEVQTDKGVGYVHSRDIK